MKIPQRARQAAQPADGGVPSPGRGLPVRTAAAKLRPSRIPAPVRPSAVRDVLTGPGEPLAAPLRQEMEARLGADFSDVRVHTGAAARASAAEIGARAYTSGSHIVIGDDADKHTLAHELTHVIQQRQGPVAGTDNGHGLKISSPGDRFEQQAETSARRALSGPSPKHTAPGTPQSQAVSMPVSPHLTGSRVLWRESSRDDRAGPNLLALIEELEVAVAVAENLAAHGGDKPPTAELNEHLKPLREIAHGSDEKAKTEALAAVRAELDQVGPTPKMEELVQGQTVQREVLSTLLAAGLGVLAWRVYGYIRDQQEDAIRDAYYATGNIPNPAIPAELTAGIARSPYQRRKRPRACLKTSTTSASAIPGNFSTRRWPCMRARATAERWSASMKMSHWRAASRSRWASGRGVSLSLQHAFMGDPH